MCKTLDMSQNSLPLTVGHPLKSLQGLARQIALPHEFAPERFPSFPALERTALMSFCQPASLDIPVGVSTKMALARQAAWPVWASQPFTGQGYAVQYVSRGFNSDATTASRFVQIEQLTNSFVSAIGTSTTRPSFSVAPGYPHAYPPIGVDSRAQGPEWFYKPAGFDCMAVAVFGPNAGVMNASFTWERWESPGEVYALSSNVTGNPLTTGLASNCPFQGDVWVRVVSLELTSETNSSQCNILLCAACGSLTYTPDAINGGAVVTSGRIGNCFLPLVAASEFANSRIPWAATRTTAAACLCTNVSQVLNKAGTVLGGRLPPNTVNMWAATESILNTLHPAEKAWLPLETGFYTYCPPSTDLSDFWDYSTPSSAYKGVGGPPPVYRLDNDALVNVWFFRPGAVAESLAITVDWHLEFRTTSALFQVALCGMTLETLHQAQIVLSSVGFFFENPNHKDILNKVVNMAKRFGPAIMQGIASFSPLAGQAIKIAKYANQVRSMNMKPTSAEASGITRKPKTKPTHSKKKKVTVQKGKKSKK